ncbi:phage tail length tape measure family protein [Tritonibacter mobilis]|uniref:Bacteriophage tail tape measure N-terminal domain-containing protein n=1 Tax=Tritonibacter mobilis F1926 TaxID=1265309 RepID=A0A1B0ZZY6_9RHOB|nr:phage tail length tape measure family protein [Tritonibacter mobilis]ANP39892.1 hypothetical protein K529_003860 [Tritonibacter mobilis F1926]KJZ21822.1 hypothetical protein TW79_20775 [Tritonibacter mobilis]
MTFVVQGEILMDGSDAKSEFQRLRAEQAKLVTSTDKVNQSSSQLRRTMQGAFSSSVANEVTRLNQNLSQTTILADAQSRVWVKQAASQKSALDGLKRSTSSFKSYGQEIRSFSGQLAVARNRAATWFASLRDVDESQQLAAGSAANLTAQFNDIGVMMAAGQSPMQLAIQQGTQITQVFGNRGAAAALSATRQAVMNMVSPLNLLTIGSVAAGAAAVQWLSKAGEEAETFEDRLKALSDAVDAFGDRQKDAFQSASDMIEKFGSASPQLRMVLADLAALAKIDAQRNIDETSQSIRQLVTEARGLRDRNSFAASANFLGLKAATNDARELGTALNQNLKILEQSEDQAKRLKAAYNLRDILLEASGGIENLSKRQAEFYDGLATLIQELEAFESTAVKPLNDLKQAGLDLWEGLLKNTPKVRAELAEVEATARSTIEQLQLEAEINEAIRTSGEGSVEVAELRLQAERELFEQRVEELTITEELKKEMMAAWDAANGVAGVDMAGNIALAAGEAQRLKNELLAAKGAAIMAAAKANPDFHDPRGESPGSGNKEYVYQDQGLPRVVLPPNPRSRRSGGGRSASSADREREAIERLMQRERERLEILRETDPVQQEMIRFRETMKSATDAEREALEKIISKRLEEQKAIEQTRELGSYLGETMQDVSAALVSSGDAAADAWDRVKASILSAILQASLLGEGPLAGAFGTDETGGFIGGLLKRADGGIITGRGGDRSDQELVLASPGEFFVNAKATRKHRHLLEAINAGSLLPAALPAFANGGAFAAPPVLPAVSAGGSSQAPGMSRVRIEPSPLFRVVVEEQSRQTAVEVNQNYDREHSGEAFNRNLNDPWSVG